MKRLLFFIFVLLGSLTVKGQTFTFECICDYVTAADSNCDICNTNIQSRLFKGILIRKNATAFKWIDQPYIVQFQGNNATFKELIPNGEVITITLAGTPFDSIPQYQDSIKCPCAGSDNFFIAGPGIYFSGDTISAFDVSPINELQFVDSFYISAGNLYVSLDRDSVAASVVTLPVPTGAETIVTAGTGISVTGTGTSGSPYVVANTLPHIGTDLTYSGTSSPLTLNSSTGSDVTNTAGTGISLTGTSSNMTITNTAPDQTVYITGAGINVATGAYPNFTITGTEVDGSLTNEAQTLSVSGTTSGIISLNAISGTGGGTATIAAGTNIGVSQSGGTITINNTGAAALSGVINQVPYFNTSTTITTEAGSGVNSLAWDAVNNKFDIGGEFVFNAPTRVANFGIVGGNPASLFIENNSSGSRGLKIGSLEFGSYATNNCWFGDNTYWAPGWIANATGPSSLFYFINGGFQYRTAPSVSAGLPTTQTSVFQITNGGMMGVGNTSAAARFSVNGAGLTGATLTAQFHNLNGNNNALVILDNGNSGFGTASPQQKMHVQGTARVTGSDGTATTVMGRDGDGDISSLALSGMSISAGTLTATDGSVTNEAWTIDADDADTEVISNQTVKFQGGGIVATDYIPGTDILTITGTEVDGSVTNEAQALTVSGTTSGILTLATAGGAGGGTAIIAAGTGITVGQSGGTITITNSSPASGGWLLDGNTITTAKRIGSNDNFDVVVETNGTDRLWFDNAGTMSLGSTQLTTAAFNINGLQTGTGMLIAGGSSLVGPNFYTATGSGSGSTATVLSGSLSMISGNVEAILKNTATTGTGGGAVYTANVTSTGSSNDPFFKWQIDGVTEWSMGIDNDDVDNLKLHRFSRPSDNNGVGTMEFGYDGTSLGVAINKTGIGTAVNAHYGLDVGGKVRGDQFVNNASGGVTTGTIALGTAAGTGPTLDAAVSRFWGNGGRIKFTSGTSPTANGVICTVTLGTEYNFGECAPIMQGRSTNAGAFNYSCSFDTGTRVVTCTLVGTLTASTVYEFNLILSGEN